MINNEIRRLSKTTLPKIYEFNKDDQKAYAIKSLGKRMRIFNRPEEISTIISPFIEISTEEEIPLSGHDLYLYKLRKEKNRMLKEDPSLVDVDDDELMNIAAENVDKLEKAEELQQQQKIEEANIQGEMRRIKAGNPNETFTDDQLRQLAIENIRDLQPSPSITSPQNPQTISDINSNELNGIYNLLQSQNKITKNESTGEELSNYFSPDEIFNLKNTVDKIMEESKTKVGELKQQYEKPKTPVGSKNYSTDKNYIITNDRTGKPKIIEFYESDTGPKPKIVRSSSKKVVKRAGSKKPKIPEKEVSKKKN